MHVTIDLDGTWYAHPAVFTDLAGALTAQGHTVGILTGHLPWQQDADRRWFADHGIPYPALALYCDPATLPEPYSVAAVGRWKAQQCADHAIDVHFDDLVETIRPTLTAPTVCFTSPS